MSYLNFVTRIVTGTKEDEIKFLQDYLLRNPHNQNSELDSVVVSGCSFIYGDEIQENETLTYKMSELIDNPVYNLGFVGRAINILLPYVEYGVFENYVKTPPKVFIYNYADFHIQRLEMSNFFAEDFCFLYKINNYKLVRKKPNFFVSRFAIPALFREKIYEYRLHKDEKYKNYLKKLLKMHFFKCKELIDERYPNVKFIILVYSDSPIFEEVATDLENAGIEIIRITKEKFGIDVGLEEYQCPGGHPAPIVWEKVAPKLVEKIKPYL